MSDALSILKQISLLPNKIWVLLLSVKNKKKLGIRLKKNLRKKTNLAEIDRELYYNQREWLEEFLYYNLQ